MAFGKFLAAASAVALITTPTMAAASRTAPIAADVRAGETSEDSSELFGSRGGLLAIILIAVVIAIGIYIVVDDEENEEPASP